MIKTNIASAREREARVSVFISRWPSIKIRQITCSEWICLYLTWVKIWDDHALRGAKDLEKQRV